MRHITRYEIKWAILFFIASLLWMVFEKLMGWHDVHIDRHAAMTNFFTIPAMAIYIFALLDKRKNYYHNQMTWQQGFISGFMITLLITVLSPLEQFVTHSMISPEYFQNAIEYSVNVHKQDRAAMEAFFNLKSYIIMGIIGTLVMGSIISAIVAIFVKRTESENQRLWDL